ncbi:hypothetical protein [Parenemella sanctibonifatiensis]|nr:hypothetical protein [Parenemella sanctibonifatiensis]
MERLPLALLAVAAVTTIGAFIMSVTLTVLNKYAHVTAAMGLSCLISLAAGVALLAAGLDWLVVATGMAAAGATARFGGMAIFVARVKDGGPREESMPRGTVQNGGPPQVG